ncbi:MAG: NupC/NupG family nucleoside CNT transporter [Polyangiaceae bacterium]|nr:NupC/NupG family nucleoside CNT transporter [Polyangiaceae bacterium]MCB9608528.1 NupC/NupG family nucleoside CNT transporter [Polyangiaceae bacterium]
MQRGQSLLGLAVLIGLAWLLSEKRGQVRWRPVLWGVALQLLLGLIVLSPALQGFFFATIDSGVKRLLSFSEAGSNFVFQSIEPHQILDPSGKAVTFVGRISPPVKTFAFWILPTIVFFSALTSILYHLGIMQRVVWGIAWVMQRTMKASGAEALSAAANIFVGQTEAPLFVKPYIAKMTRSELSVVMTGGFATVAGGVMAAYVGFLRDLPGIAGHLVTASILSAPAAIAVSKLMVPETEEPETLESLDLAAKSPHSNVLEAAATGAADGAKLAINVGAMLIAFVGLVAMVDFGLSNITVAGEVLSLSRILGWLFSPFAFIMGVPWNEAPAVGRLLGEKLVLTEFLAYIHLGDLVSKSPAVLSERSAVIASYALCGFANFASIGIQLGGIGGIAPKRMPDLASLGFKTMVGGSLAAFMTACVAGALL